MSAHMVCRAEIFTRAREKGLFMTHRLLAAFTASFFVWLSLAGTVTVATAADDIVVEGAAPPPPPPPPAAGGPRRLVDVEAAVGAIIGLNSNPPVDDNLLYGGSFAFALLDMLDAEIGFVVGDTKDRGHTLADEGHHMVKYLYGGLRYYPFTAVNAPARPYIFFGPTHYWDLEDNDDDTGLMSGVGMRFQPGENIGITLKIPVVTAVTGGPTNTTMLPTFNLYWSFNLPGNGSAS